jgi:hypothetical protein
LSDLLKERWQLGLELLNKNLLSNQQNETVDFAVTSVAGMFGS